MKKTTEKISDSTVLQVVTKQAIRYNSPELILYRIDNKDIIRFEKKLVIR